MRASIHRVAALAGIVVLLAVSLVPLAAQSVKGPPKPPDGVAFERDVVYGTGAGEELKLNLSRPKQSNGRRPCVVVIHGGAWKAGDRSLHDDLTMKFAERGYVSATLGYRFCPKHPFPAQVEDVKCAVRFLRANAEKYGIEPGRFGAVGFSAGAHLSMMLGVMDKEDGLEGDGGNAGQPSKVQAVVSFFGPTDLGADDIPDVSQPLVADFVGARRRKSPQSASGRRRSRTSTRATHRC